MPNKSERSRSPPDLAISYRSLEELIPYARNARTHSDAQVAEIAASIKAFGWTNPILIDGENGVIAGHGRLQAARQLKLKRVPCIELAGLSEAQRRAYIIADNKLATNAGWDLRLLALELGELQAAGISLPLLGFNPAELKDLVGNDAPVRQGKVGDDEVPDLPRRAISRRGDIWICGRHRVMCGDATAAADVASLMDNLRAHAIWTDPPYNVAYEGEQGTILNDDQEADAFNAMLLGAFTNAHWYALPGAAAYVCHADTERVAFTQQFIAAGFQLSQVLIWVTQTAPLSRQDYHWQHEPILYGWKPGAGHFWCGGFAQRTVLDDDVDVGKLKIEELRALVKQLKVAQATTVIRQDRPTKSELHPTMKPVALVERLLKNNTLEHQVVLDPFGGSGTTMIAAEKMNLAARLLELEPRYVDVIVQRWEKFTGRKATHEASGEALSDLGILRTPAQKPKAARA